MSREIQINTKHGLRLELVGRLTCEKLLTFWRNVVVFHTCDEMKNGVMLSLNGKDKFLHVNVQRIKSTDFFFGGLCIGTENVIL